MILGGVISKSDDISGQQQPLQPGVHQLRAGAEPPDLAGEPEPGRLLDRAQRQAVRGRMEVGGRVQLPLQELGRW